MLKDTIKKYTWIKQFQDYIENVEEIEKKGTGLLDKAPTRKEEEQARKYFNDLQSSSKGVYIGKTFKEASKDVNIITSKKQGCCQCVAFSFENIEKKFALNRGYEVGEFITDPSINYSLFNVRPNAMVGMIPSRVYEEYRKNGFVPYICSIE